MNAASRLRGFSVYINTHVVLYYFYNGQSVSTRYGIKGAKQFGGPGMIYFSIVFLKFSKDNGECRQIIKK